MVVQGISRVCCICLSLLLALLFSFVKGVLVQREMDKRRSRLAPIAALTREVFLRHKKARDGL